MRSGSPATREVPSPLLVCATPSMRYVMPAPTTRSLLSERTVTSNSSSQRRLYSNGSQVGPTGRKGSGSSGSALSLIGSRTQRRPSKPSSVSAFQ